MGRPVNVSLSTDNQLYIAADSNTDRPGTVEAVLAMLLVSSAATELLYLNVWAVDEVPASPADAGLAAADRVGGGPFPIGVLTQGKTIALGIPRGSVGWVVSISSNPNGTGDPSAAVVCSFALEVA